LEKKRQAFPRFYFLSNDELLQILSNSHNVKAIEKHINKCFDNIYGFMLVEGAGYSPDISGIISGEREEIEFYPNSKHIKVGKGGTEVEKWMQ
jgi:dynein heavy chain